MKIIFTGLVFSTFIFSFIPTLSAQNFREKQEKLELQRKRLKEEIKQINLLLFQNLAKEQTVISKIEDLNLKISVRMQLIKTNNQQANILENQINSNQINIENLGNELKILKEDYARVIRNSYQRKSVQSRLMFLFSSENFLQAYKRLEYMKQHAEYRAKQGGAIIKKTKTLQETNNILIKQKRKKEEIILENREIKKALQKEQESQQSLILSLKRKGSSLASEIKKKQKRSAIIDREIDRLIKEAIAASNKNLDTPSKGFNLTPELKILSKNFVSNKGKLPWPVKKGIITQGFGTQPHPIVKTALIKSNGVTIATVKKANIRAVFDGEVMSVLSFKGSNPTILIRHGNYISTYKNVGKVYVKKGDKITAKQKIGEVFTHPKTGKTTLQFSIFEGVTPINPKTWIYKM